MRKALFLLATLAIVSCQKPTVDYAVVSGKILNYNYDKIFLISVNNATVSKIQLNKDGSFSDTLKTISGKDLALTSIQANYVVLDFWGSWCGWCIKGFPKMKEYYAKYKGRVEIVGIACKDEDAKWRKSVQENELKWINVINSDEEDKDLRLIYGVNVYPTKIILDKDKKIIGRFMGESEAFYQKLDELMQE